MNIIEIKFKGKSINEHIIILNKLDSLDFVCECEKMNINIIGIDAFYSLDGKIQPTLEHSIDFSSKHYSLETDSFFIAAREFILSKQEDLYFEIVCDI